MGDNINKYDAWLEELEVLPQSCDKCSFYQPALYVEREPGSLMLTKGCIGLKKPILYDDAKCKRLDDCPIAAIFADKEVRSHRLGKENLTKAKEHLDWVASHIPMFDDGSVTTCFTREEILCDAIHRMVDLSNYMLEQLIDIWIEAKEDKA